MPRDRILTGQFSNSKSSHDLHTPGLFAKLPIVGILMILVGGLLFGAIAYNVWTKGPLLQWDVPLSEEMSADAAQAPHRVIEFLIFAFFVGKELLQVIVIILSLYFIHKRLWPELAMLLVGSGGGAVIWYILIGIFERARPADQIGIVVTDASFPSGHAISSVICYGLLAYLFVPKMPSRFWKWLLIIAVVFTILYVGYSRIYLGGHYLTDVIAGYGLGLAWAGLVFTVIENLFLKRKGTAR